MSWLAIAKKDFRDARRSRALWGLSAVFLLLVGGMSVAFAVVDEVGGSNPSALALIFFVASSIGTFVSLAGIVVCYRAIAGERETGSVKVLLSLPHTRRDVVVGKVLGRAAVLAVPIVGALLVGTVLGTALLGDVAPLATVLFGVVAVLFALTYAAIVVGFSATTGSTTRAAALSVGFFLVVELLWDVVVIALVFVGNDFQLPASPADFPAWIYPVTQLQPSTAFVSTLTAVIPDAPRIATGPGPAASQIDAAFATPWLGVLALALWVVVPVALGYRRFQGADL